MLLKLVLLFVTANIKCVVEHARSRLRTIYAFNLR